jgi:hypothetical protein
MNITRRSQLYGPGLGAEGPATSAVRAIKSFASTAGDLAVDQIHGVTLRSQISPDIHLTAEQAVGQQPSPGGLSTLFLQVSKPAIYVDTSLGTLRIAPYGEPTMNLYPLFLVGAMVGLGALAGVFFRGMRS